MIVKSPKTDCINCEPLCPKRIAAIKSKNAHKIQHTLPAMYKEYMPRLKPRVFLVLKVLMACGIKANTENTPAHQPIILAAITP